LIKSQLLYQLSYRGNQYNNSLLRLLRFFIVSACCIHHCLFCVNDNKFNQPADSKNPRRTGNEANLSPDGKWKSFPRTPNLLQYAPSGVFFGRIKIGGKVCRRSLETKVFTTAKLKLVDFVKEQRKGRTTGPAVLDTFRDARIRYEQDLEARHELAAASKLYRRNTITALLKTWPNLDAVKLEKITLKDCQDWANRFIAKGYESGFFNNTLGTLRAIVETGGRVGTDNPARHIRRRSVQKKKLQLPETEQFEKLLTIIETAGARQSNDCADFVRFLAYSGCRLSEARKMSWSRVDTQRNLLHVPNAKTRQAGSSQSTDPERAVPIIADMATLLQKMQLRPHSPEDLICRVGECEKSLTRACRVLDIPRITHHDLRHLFATRCIESGVDIPTVSRWLGHKDGGALAMKVYGHLRDQHSQAMAQKVSFSPNPRAESKAQSAGSEAL
jgi:integrase